jgi:uncharacterized protein (TIGR03435 family)
MQSSVQGRFRFGTRNMTLQMIANQMTGDWLNIDRPVIDRTGLSGTFDFVIEFTPTFNGPLPPGADFTPDETGPTFVEALKQQLGLKLEPQTGPVPVIVVDHVEQPSEN